jgi:hypothetical protein
MNLDFLIPKDIVAQCRLNNFDLKLGLQGNPAQNRYPNMRVKVNDDVIYDAPVVGYVEVPFTAVEDIDSYQVIIEYHSKTNNDTVVDNQGHIVQNQHVKIVKIIVNEVDIVPSQIIYNLGNYTKNLSDEQKEYYLEHGYDVGPTHSLELYENGQWTLNFKMPVLPEFIKLKKTHIKHESPWIDNITHKIYDTINNIRSIEKRIKNHDNHN